MQSIILTWFRLVSILVLLQGCAAEKINVSVPAELPHGVTGKIESTIIHLDIDNIKLSAEIQVLNPLSVWLSIEPTAGELQLNPMLVNVIMEGKLLQPITFIGPSDPWASPRALYQGCGPRKYDFGWAYSKVDVFIEDVNNGNPAKGILKPSTDLISFEGRKCFMFFYNSGPTLDNSYKLHIDGLSKSGEQIQIDGLQFRKDTVSKTFPVP
jgi:hypothetical protein